MLVDQEDIHKLSSSRDIRDKLKAIKLLYNFRSLPNKYAAWAVLQHLLIDECYEVRSSAVDLLGYIFSDAPDRSIAYTDLHNLTNDEDVHIRVQATATICYVFEYIFNKSDAFDDLQRLAYDEASRVRRQAAYSIGSTFPLFPDQCKSTSLDILIKLTNDYYSNVRMYANHFLGIICIYKASKPENDSKALLEEAIIYFEKAMNQRSWNNPAKFYYLFYRSFGNIIFNKIRSKKEIDNYIAAAKEEIKGSESKQELVKAVELLAEVLETAYTIQESEGEIQELLTHCIEIYNDVDQLIAKNKTEHVYAFYRNTRPSFDKTIKDLIDEVKEKAEVAYKESRGTPAESIACSINNQIQGWFVGSQEQMTKNLDNLIFSLKIQIPDDPKYKLIHEKIDLIRTYSKVEDQIATLTTIIPLISIQIMSIKLDDVARDVKFIILSKEETQKYIQVAIGPSTQLGSLQGVVDIPINDISYSGLKRDLEEYLGKTIPFSKLPANLKEMIAGYILKKLKFTSKGIDREVS